jgi:hypothetical protein
MTDIMKRNNLFNFRVLWLLLGTWLITGILAAPSVYAQEGKISVLNPKGAPPPIPLIPMAPRVASLDGKSLYIVDVGFKGVDNLFSELQAWFAQNLPDTTVTYRKKSGSYATEDTKLWEEVREKADAVVIAVGH